MSGEEPAGALALATHVDDPRARLRALLWASQSLLAMGDPEQASAYARELLEIAESLRDRVWIFQGLFAALSVSAATGDWETARRLSDRALAPGAPALVAIRAMVAHELGDHDQEDAELDRLLQGVIDQESVVRVDFVAIARTLSIIAQIGDSRRRLDQTEALARQVISSARLSPYLSDTAHCALAFIAWHRGDTSLAEEQYAALEDSRGQLYVRGSFSLDRLLGLLAHTMGKLDDAAAHFEAAVAFCRKAGYRPQLAWSLCDYADMLKERDGPGDGEKAVGLLDEALAISRERGMRPLMECVLSRREILRA